MLNYKYALLTNSNKNEFGFKNQVLLSNKYELQFQKTNKKCICFVSYDYKNKLESFSKKENNFLPILFQFSKNITPIFRAEMRR